MKQTQIEKHFTKELSSTLKKFQDYGRQGLAKKLLQTGGD